MTTINKWAEKYAQKYGFHLVPIEPNRKFPRENNWGKNTLSNPMHAGAFFEARQDWNVGVALGPSRVCSLDIDHYEWFCIICEAFNIDLDLLIKEYPTIKGRGYRVMFRVPEGVKLPYVKLNWRPEEDPDGSKHRELMAKARDFKKQAEAAKTDEERETLEAQEKEYRDLAKPYAIKTVFELRSACDGSQKQDILPPSMHPDTGEPYVWHTPPKAEIPEPPPWLMAIWTDFDIFRKQFLAACPWVNIEEVYKKENSAPARSREYSSDGGLVAAANEYAQNVNIEQELMRQGYTHIHGKRWLSPYSSTNLAGVVLFNRTNKCWIHHASDPLCSAATGQPVSSFDLFCEYEYGGKFVDAAKAAAAMFNMRSDSPQYNAPANGAPMMPEYIDEYEGSENPIVAEQNGAISVNYVEPLPWVNTKGKPYKHIDNLKEIANRMGAEIRYNVMTKDEEIIFPNQSFSIDNEANAALAYLSSMCSLFEFPTDKNQEFLTYIADTNHYSPVKAWVSSKEWDGQDRLQQLCNTVTSNTPDELKRTLIKRWLISAIAVAYSDKPVSAQGILVFQGKQNLGKTTWLESLVPEDVNRASRLVQTGVMLKPDDKDSVKQACSCWLVELGEIDASMRKADEAQLKAFITRSEDTMRRPYARKESTYARRTVFFGSVNPQEYLKDDTGNRRFWTIQCTALNRYHGIDMQQLWAQVLDMWLNGEKHYLTADEVEQLNEENKAHETLDPIEERLLSTFRWDTDPSKWEYRRVTDALIDCGLDRPTRADVTRAGKVINDLNGGMKKRCGKNGRLSLVPPT